jgi:UDP-3-O-[3-hydroxymyristoyl] glucosamine N-acyltransferase
MRTAGELGRLIGAKISGDADVKLCGVASPERASAGDLIYVEIDRFAGRAASSAATCVVAPSGMRLAGKTMLEVADPKLGFAKAALLMLETPPAVRGIHPAAVVAPSAQIALDASIGPFAVVEDSSEIGPGSLVGAYCFIGAGARLGANCRLHPRVTIYPSVRIGDRVEIHAGAVLGAPGFGYVFGEGRYWRFPQVGELEIGEDVEIGANTTVDRGSLDKTSLGRGVKVDNLVQIAHNVRIGEHTVIASQTGISGSSKVGKGVKVGGQVGIADHCEIEEGAILGAQAGVPTGKTIRKGETVWGTPARPLDKFKEQYGWFGRLPDLAKRIRNLERRIAGE